MKKEDRWTEDDSNIFIDYGDAFSPPRDVLMKTFDEVAFDPNASGVFVELSCGTGWLSNYLLERHSSLSAILLDVSDRMLDQAKATLHDKLERVTFRKFELAEKWPLADVSNSACAVLSSVAFHPSVRH